MTEETDNPVTSLFENIPNRERNRMLSSMQSIRRSLDEMEKAIKEEDGVHWLMGALEYQMFGKRLSEDINAIAREILGREKTDGE